MLLEPRGVDGFQMNGGKKERASLGSLIGGGGFELGLKDGTCFGKSRELEEDSGQRENMLRNHQRSAMAQIQGERESEIVRLQRKIEMMSFRVFMPSSEAEFCE